MSSFQIQLFVRGTEHDKTKTKNVQENNTYLNHHQPTNAYAQQWAKLQGLWEVICVAHLSQRLATPILHIDMTKRKII